MFLVSVTKDTMIVNYISWRTRGEAAPAFFRSHYPSFVRRV